MDKAINTFWARYDEHFRHASSKLNHLDWDWAAGPDLKFSLST